MQPRTKNGAGEAFRLPGWVLKCCPRLGIRIRRCSLLCCLKSNTVATILTLWSSGRASWLPRDRPRRRVTGGQVELVLNPYAALQDLERLSLPAEFLE